MGRTYRTAMGKNIDIDNLRLSNEDAIAVGNMKVNARGDQLGPGGQVVQGRNQSMDQFYNPNGPVADPHSVVAAQRRAGATVTQGRATARPAPPPSVDPDGIPFDQPTDTASAQPVQPQMRGSFADSIAREVTVTQDLLTPPNKPKGPTRI